MLLAQIEREPPPPKSWPKSIILLHRETGAGNADAQAAAGLPDQKMGSFSQASQRGALLSNCNMSSHDFPP